VLQEKGALPAAHDVEIEFVSLWTGRVPASTIDHGMVMNNQCATTDWSQHS
jgi:hypothetical protein